MKIVHCTFNLITGGAETMLIDIVNEMAEYSSNILYLFILNNNSDRSLMKKISSKVHIIEFNRQKGSYNIFPIVKMNYLLLKMHPDIVHLHFDRFIPLIKCPWLNVVFTVHDINISNKYFHKVKHLFAISDAVKDYVLKNGNYPVTVIANGIRIDDIKKAEYNCSHPFKIIQVARLEHLKKGQDILIKALHIIREEYGIKDIVVDFIGVGESEKLLLDLIIRFGLSSNIHLLGLKDRDYIYNHLKDYNMMCHPSRFEGFGLSITEAMAAKIPVLVSKGDGPYEIIAHGKYGYSFKKGDHIDCARMINFIYLNYDKALSIAEKGYEYLNLNYSVKRMVADYIEEYRKLV